MTTKMIFVEVTDDPVQPGRPYVDKNTQMQKMTSASQTVFFHQGLRYPTKFSIDVPAGASPFRPGFYVLAGEIFQAGEYSRPKLNTRNLDLVSVEEALAALQPLAPEAPVKLKAAS